PSNTLLLGTGSGRDGRGRPEKDGPEDAGRLEANRDREEAASGNTAQQILAGFPRSHEDRKDLLVLRIGWETGDRMEGQRRPAVAAGGLLAWDRELVERDRVRIDE